MLVISAPTAYTSAVAAGAPESVFHPRKIRPDCVVESYITVVPESERV